MEQSDIFLNHLLELSGELVDYKKQRKEQEALKNRSSELNEKFIFSDDAICKLNKLNTILREMEGIIYEKCCRLEADILKRNKTAFPFTDYEIAINISFYSTSFDEKYKEYQTAEIWSNKYGLDFRKKEFRLNGSPKTNWKNFDAKFYIDNDITNVYIKNMTRSFYELITNNSPLAFEDILQIDKIWWDIKIEYQYMEEFKL